MENINTILQNILNNRLQEGLYRNLNTSDSGIDFYSNDYLGLSNSTELKKDIRSFVTDFQAKNPEFHGLGSSGSRLISGNHFLFEQFEEVCAKFHKAESALFFGSGYEANTGLISSIGQEGHIILCDKLIHASLIDGLRLSKAEKRIFKHNDLADLEKILKQYPIETPKWVVVESVYSMDGDQAPLEGLIKLKNEYHFELIVDEAHAGGIYGPQGEGMCVEKNIHDQIYARVITFGKAWGYSGAIVLGNQTLRNFLINFARPFIYSTAPPPQHVLELMAIQEFIKGCQKQRMDLNNNISYFIAHQKSNKWIASKTAIQSFIIPGNEAVRLKAKQLQEEGFNVKPIVYPTVAKGTERIRITLHSFQNKQDILHLISLLEKND
jgi:8-amino-7-oxononanoate synthase